MKRIDSLTAEQIAKMAEWRDKWIDIGLSTEPANRPEAEKGVILAYAARSLATTHSLIINEADSVEMYEKDEQVFVRILGAEFGIRIATEVNDWGTAPVRD